MMSTSLQRWSPPMLTLMVWALVAAGVAQWSLRWGGLGAAVSVGSASAVAQNASTPVPDNAAVARVLGSSGAAPMALAATSRYQLTGVVAASPSGRGAALLAIDGKPPRAYRVGAKIEEGLYLVAVAPRQAQLGAAVAGPVTLTLELPPKK